MAREKQRAKHRAEESAPHAVDDSASRDVHRRPMSVERLIEELARLPGIGRRSAERLADHLVRRTRAEAMALAEAIAEVKAKIVRCARCGLDAETSPCDICSDPSRDGGILCVVASPRDVLVLERSGAFRGLYHVLDGRVSLLEGRGPGDVGVEALESRVRRGGVREVVLALDSDAEGDYTALTVARALEGTAVALTRIARGLPAGATIELASPATLEEALQGRRPLGDREPDGRPADV